MDINYCVMYVVNILWVEEIEISPSNLAKLSEDERIHLQYNWKKNAPGNHVWEI